MAAITIGGDKPIAVHAEANYAVQDRNA